MAGLAFFVSPLVILAIGLRPDAPQMGPLLTWFASAAQFALAMALIWIAARESTPAAASKDTDSRRVDDSPDNCHGNYVLTFRNISPENRDCAFPACTRSKPSSAGNITPLGDAPRRVRSAAR